MNNNSEQLERESARTLYEQIIDRLRTHVGTLRVGEQAPTEAELTRLFSVGRSTIRKALQRLTDEGVLIRQRGKGTFVAHASPKIVHPIDRVAAFMDTFRVNNESFETRLIDFGWNTTVELPEALVGWKRPVLHFLRLYTTHGVPHAVAQVYLPHDIGRGLAAADIEAAPIYTVLRDKLGIVPAGSDYLVSCRQPPPLVSKHLAIPHSMPLLVLQRVTRDKEGHPVEMTIHYLRPDVYQLSVSIARNE